MRYLAGRRITRKRMLMILIAIVALLVAVNFGVAWHYSGVLNHRALKVRHEPFKYNVTASEVGEGIVRLEDGPEEGRWRLPGRWGLEWEGGNGMIGEIVEGGGDFVVRRFTLAEGDSPNSDAALVSGYIYPQDPFLAFGIEYEDVQYETPLGMQDAWKIRGEADTWVIFVHGHRGGPEDGLVLAPILHDLGLPALFITYRNDEGQPRDPGGIHQFGVTEWEDLHAATEYVLSQPDARNIVLIGISMGGGIIVKFLYESALASGVTGVVLDSPVLDFKATVDYGARKLHLPGLVTAPMKWIGSMRFGVDWDAMDYLKDADRLDKPILLIHGGDDLQVPIETSNKLAELRPEIVTYSVYADTPHGGSWNVDSGRYERELKGFLLSIVK